MSKADEILNKVCINGENPSLRINGIVSSGGSTSQLTASQNLSLGELNYTSTIGNDFIINGVYFKFDNATTQDISLEYNNVEIFKETAITVNSAFIDAENFKILGSLGKELTVKCTNTGTPNITIDVIIDIEVI